MKYQNTFQNTLAYGKEAEQEFRQVLINEGWEVYVPKSGFFPHYDLLALKADEAFKYEVKTDTQTIKTNNVACEIGKVIWGEKFESGLSKTQADYYCQKIAGLHFFYLVQVPELKKLVSRGNYKTLMTGDNESVITVLIPLPAFMSIVEKKIRRLKNDHKETLQTINTILKGLKK